MHIEATYQRTMPVRRGHMLAMTFYEAVITTDDTGGEHDIIKLHNTIACTHAPDSNYSHTP